MIAARFTTGADGHAVFFQGLGSDRVLYVNPANGNPTIVSYSAARNIYLNNILGEYRVAITKSVPNPVFTGQK